MNTLLGIVIAFLASAAAVVLAGVTLARSGDVIAARTRLGGLWVGSIFLAVATSLPELTTDIAAVRLGAPDLAAGDLFGSNMANMLVLALVALPPGAQLFHRAALDHGLAAALAIIMTCTAAIFILLDTSWTVLGIGPGAVVVAVVYLAGTRAVYRQSALMRRAGVTAELAAAEAPAAGAGLPSLKRAVVGSVLAAAVIAIAAPVFAASAARVAELTGIGTTFVGTLLVGMATSLPELVTSLTAVRIGALDLAIGNLFGSNAVNMVLVLPLDLAQPGGPFLAAVSPVHALTALVGVVLMGIALMAIVYRAGRQVRALDPASLLMMGVYVVGLLLVYLRGG